MNTVGDRWDAQISEVTHKQPLDRTRFDFPQTSAQPLPDKTMLIKEVSAHREEIERMQERYACTAVVTFRGSDKRGAGATTY